MSDKIKILIFGAGGHGKVVQDILLGSGKKVIGFLDDDRKKIGRKVNGLPVLGGWKYLRGKKICLALGIGNNKIREKVFYKAKKQGIKIISLIHPKAIVSRSVKIGEGVVIMPGAVVNAGTVIEDGVVINTASSVDHDCYLERFCQIWPGAHLAGSVRVGRLSYIGTGASVIQDINIGQGVMIGSSAAVVSDIPDNVTAVGVPARIIKGK